MSGPERIEIPDGVAAGPRNTRCPGAYLMITRDDFRELAHHGQVWTSGIEDIPAEGRGPARAFCRNEVETVVRPHGTYLMGLCRACGVMESNQRKDLRERAEKSRRP